MQALFIVDTYFSRGPGGEIFAHGAFPYSLWAERFLPHFDRVTVIGRSRPYDPETASGLPRSDGPGTRFCLLESISSPLGVILGSGAARAEICGQVGQADAVIVRGPSEFGMIAAQMVKLTSVNKPARIPLAIELSGCAFDHMWHHGSLTGKIYAPVKYWRARQMVNKADTVMYVTKSFLQSRYSARGTIANASNVEIEPPSPDILISRLQKIENQRKIIFGLIGNHANKLKGIDIALAALTRALGNLPPFEFRVLGTGPQDNESFVRYDGPCSDPNDVLRWLDNIDVYLQPSRHEGLPRALIEAMSRACPALGSDAGGIPELLPIENIHRVGDIHTLTQQIIRAADKNWQREQAKTNFETAKNYTRDILLPVREKFWSDFAALARRRKSELSGQAKHENIFVEI